MPNNCLSVLYKRIVQVENKNVGLKVGGGHKHTIAPPNQKSGGAHAPLAPPPPPLPTPVYIYNYIIYCAVMLNILLYSFIIHLRNKIPVYATIKK